MDGDICWINLNESNLKWAIIAPLLVVTATNVYVWARTLAQFYGVMRVTIPQAKKWNSTSKKEKKSLKVALKAVLPFFLTMGPSWGLVFILSFVDNLTFSYVFSILNAWSGLWFILLRCWKDEKSFHS